MISAKASEIGALTRQLHHPFNHAARGGAAINQITQQDQMLLCRRTGGMVSINLSQQLVQKIQPPVNIAYGIDSLPRWHARFARSGLG